MELCLGSMMDFCLGRLPEIKELDIAMIMWGTTRGLEYLHNNKIVHGSLELEKVLLWRKRLKLEPIAKVGGYVSRINGYKVKI